jgi:hypothetical protein
MIQSFYIAKDAEDAIRRKRELDGRGGSLPGVRKSIDWVRRSIPTR